ncbi:MAG: hypothetical protein ACOC3V_01645 [bacterium]
MLKDNWYSKEKKKFFKGKTKKDSSGKGLRLNKGRGGCSISKQKNFGKGKYNTQLKDLLLLGGGTILVAEALDTIN